MSYELSEIKDHQSLLRAIEELELKAELHKMGLQHGIKDLRSQLSLFNIFRNLVDSGRQIEPETDDGLLEATVDLLARKYIPNKTVRNVTKAVAGAAIGEVGKKYGKLLTKMMIRMSGK